MSLCLLAACSEADDIRDRIDRQNERLAALENLVEQVNGNVLAISALFDESILIAGEDGFRRYGHRLCAGIERRAADRSHLRG